MTILPLITLLMNYPPAYFEGIRLFNAGHFWHAHEQWEFCWLKSVEPNATFYKGIIQAAAALVKWHQGNRCGMQRNWAKSRRKLRQLPDHFQGLDIQALIMAMDQFVAAQTANANDIPPPLLTLHILEG